MTYVMQRADVGMIQTSDGASFALKSPAQLGTICKMRRKNLDGDDAIEASVSRLSHIAHPTPNDSGEDFIRP
jgi:hypothetical protein